MSRVSRRRTRTGVRRRSVTRLHVEGLEAREMLAYASLFAAAGMLNRHRSPIAADLGFAAEGAAVPLAALHRLNSAPEQLERALEGLLRDGLAEMHDGGLRLPA